jgi:hypothetical protein
MRAPKYLVTCDSGSIFAGHGDSPIPWYFWFHRGGWAGEVLNKWHDLGARVLWERA